MRRKPLILPREAGEVDRREYAARRRGRSPSAPKTTADPARTPRAARAPQARCRPRRSGPRS
ncbi:hypothetical protein CSW60_15880 [Caulobacter sp. X]|nr:hypothetical protein CSW60_15880 [Caulobacter sp. X]